MSAEDEVFNNKTNAIGEATHSPVTKKPRLDSDLPEKAHGALGMLRADLLSPESQQRLREQVATSQPYTHAVMLDVFNPDKLRQVRDEIINHVQATYKETDLFKVFQTGDLANLDDLDAASASKLTALAELRSALYSPEFRQFVREVTGCGELSARTDCSSNVYPQGGHLLCHDDVIGTRRVSYIIYLTDPDEPWLAEDGGALELYPLVDGEPHTPAVTPSKMLLPLWNSMAMFVVQPGRSFHAVQEVYAASKPRMSISGWYHAPSAPEDAQHASLQQLVAGADVNRDFQPFVDVGGAAEGTAAAEDAAAGPSSGSEPELGPLSAEHESLLREFVHETYLDPASWAKIRSKFEADGSTQLMGFLRADVARRLAELALAEDEADALGRGRVPEFDKGVDRSGWTAIGPPHKQRYLRYHGPPGEASAGAELAALRDRLFRSSAFAVLLQRFTTLSFTGQQGEVRRFRAGLDYSVAHFGVVTKDPVLDAVLCFVDDGSVPRAPPADTAAAGQSSAGEPVKEAGQGAENSAEVDMTASEAWGCGEVGGFEAYLLADEDKGAAAEEVYRKDADESGVINVPASSNCLNLVLRDEGLMKFVKFVSFQAPSSRWDLAMEYLPVDDSDDEDGREDAEGAMD